MAAYFHFQLAVDIYFHKKFSFKLFNVKLELKCKSATSLCQKTVIKKCANQNFVKLKNFPVKFGVHAI